MIWYATSSYASPIHGSKIPGTFNVFTGDIEEYSKESKKFVGFRLTKIRPPRRFSYRLLLPKTQVPNYWVHGLSGKVPIQEPL